MTERQSTEPDRSVALMALLSLTVALNVSQAAVVCIGGDGHISIELAGHRHCGHDADHHEHDVYTPQAGVSVCEEYGHCRPCTDIPLSTGTSETRAVSKAVPEKAAVVIHQLADLYYPVISPMRRATTAPLDETAYPIPLRSIVLQV